MNNPKKQKKFEYDEIFKKKCTFAAAKRIGVWRSWLAHLHGVQGVGSSSLLTPTKRKGNAKAFPFFIR